MSGQVTLVGAGPGDPGLLTIKAQQVLERAQVVVYDRLVSPAILALIPPGAERINVGKASSHHPVPQEEINRILLEKAQQGKQVVRLKGGDPFLFGRGGEELELLKQHGIAFQVVPGVTSAIAVPAYGGIPVTHRDWCSSVHIVTGHARAGKALNIDFDALVRTGGTLVFLMGVTALPQICAGLLAAGMRPDMPAAMIERGATPRQRRLNATVATLAEQAELAQIESPAISIVGGVCSLADEFDWFDALPLKGRRIVVTRPRERMGTLSSRLRDLGADVLEYPCIETVPISPCPDMQAQLNRLETYQWLAFTSPAGVQVAMRALEAMGKDARALAPVRLAAIGAGTDGELRRYGLRADFIPAVYDAAHLGRGLAECADGPVLILRAQEGSPELTRALEAGGVPYTDVAVYTTRYENHASGQLRQALETGGVTMATFTSASTVKGFVASVGEDFDFSCVTAVCIGAQTAQAAQAYRMRTVVAKRATIDDLIDAIIEKQVDEDGTD